MSTYDAPNQQVVREDGSGPGIQAGDGNGGEEEPLTIDEMTKAQLLVYADEHNVAVDSSMTKDEIKTAIQGAETE
jgi:hypothetical protein